MQKRSRDPRIFGRFIANFCSVSRRGTTLGTRVPLLMFGSGLRRTRLRFAPGERAENSSGCRREPMLQFDEETSRRVEAIYSTPDVVAQRKAVLQTLELHAGERVLD